MKKGGESNISDKLLLKQAVRKKINYLLKKPNTEPGDAYNLVKDFFKAFTGHDYEFTREELVEEVNKVYMDENEKKHLENIILKLGMIEFYHAEYTPDEIKHMLQEFKESVEKLIHADAKAQPHNFWEGFATKLSSHIKKEDEKKEKKKPTEVTPMQKFISEANSEFEDVKEEPRQEPQIQPETIPAEQFQETIPMQEEKPPEPQPEPQTPVAQQPQEIPVSQPPKKPLQPAPAKNPQAQVPPSQDLGHFEQSIKNFYEHLNQGSIDLAKLEYEELTYHYDKLNEQEKRISYEKLKKAHDSLG